MSYRREHNERAPLPGAGHVEDYTTPFLWAAGMLLFVALFALWANFGLAFVLIVAAAADFLLQRKA